MDSRDREEMPFDRPGAFERRAGLPEKVCRAVAHAALAAGNVAEDDLVLEIGAGTGRIGRRLITGPGRYLGLDLSAGMLARFRSRLGEPARGWALVRADAARPWPVRGGQIRLFFASRSLHLLPAAHVAAELERLAAPGGATLIAGSVRRDPQGVKERLRRELVSLLGDGTDRRREDVLGDLEKILGGRKLPAREVASWEVSTSAQEVLQGWRSPGGLAGRRLSASRKISLLQELERRAMARFSDLNQRESSEESYRLEGFRFGGEVTP